MGASSSQQLMDEDLIKFEQGLEFIAEKQTSSFGFIRIYKMLQKPYQYLMRKTYYGFSHDPGMIKKYQLYQSMEKDKQSISIDFMKMSQREGPCGKSLQLSIFCKYYFYTIQDAIQQRMKKKFYFSDRQILYVFESLFHLYKLFHQNGDNQYLELFKTSKIFLTPQGFIKIYPFITMWQSQSGESFLHDNKNKVNTKYTMENQSEIHLNLQQDKIDSLLYLKTKKDDLKDIGIVLLEILTLAKQKDYKDHSYNIKQNIVKFILEKSENKNIGVFRNLLKGIIEQNWPDQQVEEQMERIHTQCIVDRTFCLKFPNTEENEGSETTEKEEIWDELKKQKLLKLSRGHLVAGKIQTISMKSSIKRP